MVATVVISAVIGVWLFINIRKMVQNVKSGKSIDGCNGDCGHCNGGCHH